jgi:hypothetical protein
MSLKSAGVGAKVPAGSTPPRREHLMSAGCRSIYALLVTAALFLLCGFSLDNAIVPKSDILAGGPPKDGIPALLAPHFISADQADLTNDDPVIGVTIDGEARAYPINILNWHEAVNDEIQDQPILITF